MLNYEFPPIGGGGGWAHSRILRHFARESDLHVTVLTSGLAPGIQQESFSDNITIHKIGIRKKNLHYWRKSEVLGWLFKASRFLKSHLKNHSYDLAHAFFAFPTGWLCYHFRDQMPYILSLRGSDVPGYNPQLGLDYRLLAGTFRKIWSHASAIVANSAGLRDLALQFTPDLPIQVITNGVDTDMFCPPQQGRSLSPPIQLLTTGRLITRKRIDLLIRAVDVLRRGGLDVQLRIVGHGNQRPFLEDLTTRLRLADYVHFLGRIPSEKMPELYQSSDLFLMASTHEGMSNSMLEALACGLPVITTPCEGTGELIVQTGLTVDATAESFAQTVKKLIADPSACHTFSQNARRHAREFAWPDIARQYLCCYKNTLPVPADSL